MLTTALLNKKGLTLIEVMIALVVLLVLLLALMQTALVSIDSNVKNLLRNEAVSIAEQRINDLRSKPFTDSELTQTSGTAETAITRNFRGGISIDFTPTRIVTDRGTEDKEITINVAWAWKGINYTHSVTSIMRKQ